MQISLSSPELLTFFFSHNLKIQDGGGRHVGCRIFRLCKFGYSGVLIVWYLCSVPNLVQIYVIVTETDALMLLTFTWWRNLMKLPVSTFGHLRMAVMHLPIKFGADIFIQSGVIDIFPKFKMAAAAILDFQAMWIWPLRQVDSVVLVLCTKFGSNTSYCHWDRRTYPSDLHLMTSRELTSGFDIWSRGHLRMAAMHLPIKFGADIFI